MNSWCSCGKCVLQACNNEAKGAIASVYDNFNAVFLVSQSRVRNSTRLSSGDPWLNVHSPARWTFYQVLPQCRPEPLVAAFAYIVSSVCPPGSSAKGAESWLPSPQVKSCRLDIVLASSRTSVDPSSRPRANCMIGRLQRPRPGLPAPTIGQVTRHPRIERVVHLNNRKE